MQATLWLLARTIVMVMWHLSCCQLSLERLVKIRSLIFCCRLPADGKQLPTVRGCSLLSALNSNRLTVSRTLNSKYCVVKITKIKNNELQLLFIGPLSRTTGTRTLRNINTLYHHRCPHIPHKHSQPPSLPLGSSTKETWGISWKKREERYDKTDTSHILAYFCVWWGRL